jgi:hypothetical protein
MRTVHTSSHDDIAALRDGCRHIDVAEIESCPLCSWKNHEVGIGDWNVVPEHVALHLLSFSLRALPWADNVKQKTEDTMTFSVNKVYQWLSKAQLSENPNKQRLPYEKAESMAGYFQENPYFADSTRASSLSVIGSADRYQVELEMMTQEGPVSFGSRGSDEWPSDVSNDAAVSRGHLDHSEAGGYYAPTEDDTIMPDGDPDAGQTDRDETKEKGQKAYPIGSGHQEDSTKETQVKRTILSTDGLQVVVDSGTDFNWISRKIVKSYDCPIIELEEPFLVQQIDGGFVTQEKVQLTLEGNSGEEYTTELFIAPKSLQSDIILGSDFIQSFGLRSSGFLSTPPKTAMLGAKVGRDSPTVCYMALWCMGMRFKDFAKLKQDIKGKGKDVSQPNPSMPTENDSTGEKGRSEGPSLFRRGLGLLRPKRSPSPSMLRPSYFLVESFDFPPEGPIKLGNIITSPSLPNEPLNEALTIEPSMINRTVQSDWRFKYEQNSNSTGIWASFLSRVIGLGSERLPIDIELSCETLTTLTLERSNLLLENLIADDAIQAYLRRHRSLTASLKLYWITGLKIASGAKLTDTTREHSNSSLHVKADVGNLAGVPIDIGPKVDYGFESSKVHAFGGSEDFVIAYRVTGISISRSGNVKSFEVTEGAQL